MREYFTCCKNSLSGSTVSSHGGWTSDCWKITFVSFRKFFPNINNSAPPVTGHDVNDFLQISGTPGGWAEIRKEDKN